MAIILLSEPPTNTTLYKSTISSVSYRPNSLGLHIGNNGTVRTSKVEPKHQRNVSKISLVPPYRAKSSRVHYGNNNHVSTSHVKDYSELGFLNSYTSSWDTEKQLTKAWF